MKRDIRLQTPDFRLVAVILCLCLLTLAAAAVAANPYEAIVGRNVFGLKPPTLVAPPPPPPAAAATTIKLQGISTILDRRQVLLKVKTAARPPEPAKEKSYLWGEGQGEDEIEVLTIDAVAGIVTIKSHGETLPPLTMKDDAEKPAAGAALPGPAAPNPQVPTLPSLPPPASTAVPPANSGGVPAMGGSGRTIPTRSLRTSATDGAGLSAGTAAPGTAAANLTTQPSATSQRSLEESILFYEANRLRREQSGGKFITFPPHPALKQGSE